MQKYKIGASVNTYSTREQLRMIYRHHERINEKYANKNVDLTLKQNNYYYVAPDTGKSYIEMFKEKEEEGLFSTKGISREYPVDEIVIEVKGGYFDNNRDKAIEVFGKVVVPLVDIIGEQNVLSAVMHCDEKYIDEYTGDERIHFHVHVVFIPTAEKVEHYTKCAAKRNPDLYARDNEGNIIENNGERVTKVKNRYIQASRNKFWKEKFGFNSYSNLQTFVAEQVKDYNLERGNKNTKDQRSFHKDIDTLKAQRQRENIEKLEIKEANLNVNVINMERYISEHEPKVREIKKETEQLKDDLLELTSEKEDMQRQVEQLRIFREKEEERVRKISEFNQKLEKERNILEQALDKIRDKYERTVTELDKMLQNVKVKRHVVEISMDEFKILKAAALKSDEANRIIREKDSIINAAKRTAKTIIDKAKEKIASAESLHANFEKHRNFHVRVQEYYLEHDIDAYRLNEFIASRDGITPEEVCDFTKDINNRKKDRTAQER